VCVCEPAARHELADRCAAEDLRKQWRAAVRGTQFTGFTGTKSTDTDAAAPSPAQRVVVLLLCPSYPYAYAGEERFGVGWPEHMADLCHPQNENDPQVCLRSPYEHMCPKPLLYMRPEGHAIYVSEAPRIYACSYVLIRAYGALVR
jgi:hypothetical protein